MIQEGNILRPSVAGHWLTDGEVWSDEVWLGREADPGVWTETEQGPPEPEEEETNAEENGGTV